MNLIQKYPHIIESFACILNMFVFMSLFPINLLISLGICSTPKRSKYIISLFYVYKAIQCVPKKFVEIYYLCASFYFLGKLSLEKTPLNLGLF